MTSLSHAEAFWLVHRRAPRVAATLATLLALGVPLARSLSTTGDVSQAVARAEHESAQAAAAGLQMPAAVFYVEPRYALASQLPLDVAALSLAVALVVFLGATLSVGGEWRTGTVRLSFPAPHQRGAPTAVRLAGWAVIGLTLGAAATTTGAAGLLAVGHAGGLTDGASLADLAGVVVRGALLVGAAGLVGAALATITRSEVVVVAAGLLYVVVAEILLLGLLGAERYESPGSATFYAVQGMTGRQVDIACGDVPVCPVVSDIGWAQPLTYATAAAALCVLSLVAVGAARRPVWR